METVSVEALLRWRHPQSGTIMPEKFIPLAESSGLITLIGDWVLDAAAHQAAVWRRLGRPMKTAINVSAAQIEQPDFSAKVAQVLRRHRLSGGDIELEVTESMLPDDRDSAGRNARRLRRAGIDLSIDDFGAGVAGIDTLKWLPARAIKFDKSLIDSVDSDARQSALVGGLIGLAHAIDAISIAEGVETKSQMDTLKSLGCDQIQGYLLSRPVPWQDVDAGFCWYVGDDVEAGD
jgi:EAL domain-containing protein (putative c-di-GMP-specific phosphodiesterase class I)